MSAGEVEIVRGLPEALREEVGILFEQAFAQKMAVAIPDEARRRVVMDQAFCLEHAFGAMVSGKLIGVLGLRSRAASFTSGMTYRSLIRELGIVSGHRAALFFAMIERKPRKAELIIDCVAVDRHSRGLGVGSKLLAAAIDVATAENFNTLSLEVVDTNPNARRLYERLGFEETKTQKLGIFSKWFGFKAVSILSMDTDVSC